MGVGVPHSPVVSLSAHLLHINSAHQRCNADKTLEGPICPQIGLEQSPFVGKLGFCTPPTVFFSVPPA